MSHRYGVHVVGVQYRLSPEHPWPAALDDAIDTLSHFAAHADEYGMDASKFYLVGYSAGADLAVATCLRMAQDSRWDPRASGGCVTPRVEGVLLHYPFLDAAQDPGSLPTHEGDISVDMSRAFNEWYVGGNDPENPLISPFFATDAQLAALPRVVMYPVLEDALFASAYEFYERLSTFQSHCTFHVVQGTHHAYLEQAMSLEREYKVAKTDEQKAEIEARAQKAADVFARSFDELLGSPVRDVPFRPLYASEDARWFCE